MVVVMFITVVVVTVVGAAFRRRSQFAVQIGVYQRFHRLTNDSGADFDALLGEKREGALANAARDNNLCALFAQPTREKSRRVRWRYHWLDADNFPLLGVGLHERELPAAAKMSVKPSFDCGNCDGYHVCFFSVGTSGVVATRIS